MDLHNLLPSHEAHRQGVGSSSPGRARRVAALLVLAAALAAMCISARAGQTARPGGPPATQPAAEGATPADIARWIDRLGGSSYEERQRAYEALRRIGLPAVPELRKALADKDPERSQRAQALLRDLWLRKETWRNRWEGMTLAFKLQAADPAAAMELAIDAQGRAVGIAWDSARKAAARYEAILQGRDLEGLVANLGRLQPWNLDKVPAWPAGDGATRISLTITVEGQFASIEQPWPAPAGIARTEENAMAVSGLMQVQMAARNVLEVLRRETAIREQSGRAGPAMDTPATAAAPPAGEGRSAIQKVIDLLSLPWQEQLSEEQLDEAAASIKPVAKGAIAAIMKPYNENDDNAYRHRAVRVFQRLGGPEAQAVLLDIALGRTKDKLPSSSAWAARAFLRISPEAADIRELLVSDDGSVLNPALLALKGTPVDEPLLGRIRQISQRKDKDAVTWAVLRFAVAEILASDTRPDFIIPRVEIILAMLADVANMPDANKIHTWQGNWTQAETAHHRFMWCLSQMPPAAEEHLDKALAKLTGPDRDVVAMALAQRGAKGIRPEVLRILQDEKAGLRRAWAALALEQVGTAEDLPLLKKVAESDPLQRDRGGDVGRPDFRNAPVFPVRDAARRTIKAIEGGSPPPTTRPARP